MNKLQNKRIYCIHFHFYQAQEETKVSRITEVRNQSLRTLQKLAVQESRDFVLGKKVCFLSRQLPEIIS